jgi:opacity protein-like surface antigen
MMMGKTYLVAALCLAASMSRAFAEDAEIDIRSFEYVDVIETADGSIWKGVVVEQTPNVQYKIATADGSLHVIKAGDVAKLTKQKNREWRGTTVNSTTPTGGPSGPVGGGGGNGVGARFEPSGPALPAPYAQSGLRIDAGGITVFPSGDISMLDTSFSPNILVGYEHLFGNFGLGGGALARFTYWRLPQGEDPQDAAWTFETHAYARAALHVSRVAFYGGASIGADTNMVHVGVLNMSKTTTGFGMNLQAGAEVAASEQVAIKLGFDYHPGTDTVIDGAPQSISYYALGLGASLRM